MPTYGGTSRGMKKFFVHSEYRDKAGATPGANDGNGMIPVGTKVLVALPLRAQLLMHKSQCVKERTERRISGESCLSEASYEPLGAE